MGEPTSEWGRQVVDKLERLEREFLRFQTKINTLVAVIGSLGATALALTAYILLTLSGLQSSVAVLQSTTSRTSDDLSRDRETKQNFKELLETISKRLDKIPAATPTPTPNS